MKAKSFVERYQKEVNGVDRFLFFAPGRVNLMGDHTDYTGGWVLPAALSLGTWLYVKLIPEKELRIYSENIGEQVILPLENFSEPRHSWTDYSVGVLCEMVQKGWNKQGMELVYYGDVPIGAGLASSASMEMVTAFALNTIFSLGFRAKETALLAQHAEQYFVGMPCGIMDQYSIAMAKPEHALLLNCHDVEHQEVPAGFPGYTFFVADSGVKHTLVQSAYASRVKELEQVKQLINTFFELPYLGMLTGEDHEWLDKLVEEPLLKKRLRHVVNENTRVEVAAAMLKQQNAEAFGKLMYDSHNSLAFDFEVSSPEQDALVRIASQTEGVAGARMTGAGFGGSTLHLVKKEAVPRFIDRIKSTYKKEMGKEVRMYELMLTGETKMVSPE